MENSTVGKMCVNLFQESGSVNFQCFTLMAFAKFLIFLNRQLLHLQISYFYYDYEIFSNTPLRSITCNKYVTCAPEYLLNYALVEKLFYTKVSSYNVCAFFVNGCISESTVFGFFYTGYYSFYDSDRKNVKFWPILLCFVINSITNEVSRIAYRKPYQKTRVYVSI